MEAPKHFEQNVSCSDDFFMPATKGLEFLHVVFSCMHRLYKIWVMGVESAGSILCFPELAAGLGADGLPL